MNNQLMTIYRNPDREQLQKLIQRPQIGDNEVAQTVSSIISEVKLNRDEALAKFNAKYEVGAPENIHLRIKEREFKVDEDLKEAIQTAKKNIEKFHKAQRVEPRKIETSEGITCWQQSVPIENVGLYIPGGTAPLFSSLLMLAIPAKLAGCKSIVVCTPPNDKGDVNPIIGWTAQLLGIEEIFLTGGAQAIGAMTFGTESIPQVNKIFGPGNRYVTAAKQLAQQEGIAIDMPAGPSEVLVIADESANPSFVAADLLSQAEHGPDSQVILVTDSDGLLEKVNRELVSQLDQLPRKEFATQSLNNGSMILVNSLNEAIDFSNTYAPEHLIIATRNSSKLAPKVVNAGSVFLGRWSCESAGDYASGTNHTLPTNGYSRSYSGVSLDSFMKKITFQELSEKGILSLGPVIERMAEAEQLQAHKNAVTLRLKELNNV